MTDAVPRVTVGVPVYNAERFLEETLDSLLSQTLRDCAVVISDNASTDRTEEICRAYASRDTRVRYVRNDVNRGAGWNHNAVFEGTRSPYFKWAAADDVCLPDYLERCVDVLERDPGAVLCQPQALEIDDGGRAIGPYRHRLRVTDDDVLTRWTDLLMIGYACYHVYGVIRTGALRSTGLIGGYIESDMVLLAELALHGRFAEIDDELFHHRLHAGQSVKVHESIYDRGAWFDSRAAQRPVFPTWRLAIEYLRALRRAPVHGRTEARCLAATARWANFRRRSFARDVKVAGRVALRRG